MAPAPIHVFLSPHLDDAVLSCGGWIHHLTSRGTRAVVATLCAGAPPAGPISPFARLLHARWNLPADGAAAADAVAARRAEDAAALDRLGAEGRYADEPDVIYRRSADGGWLAHADADLFAGEARLAPADVARAAGTLSGILGEIAGPPSDPAIAVYAPLGIGGHVDHWLVRRAAERWWSAGDSRAHPLAYYEDYPYAASPAARRAVVGRGLRGMADRPDRWTSRYAFLDPIDLDAKIAAIGEYRSQLSSFWSGEAEMAAAVRAFAAARGAGGRPAERLWRRAVMPGKGTARSIRRK